MSDPISPPPGEDKLFDTAMVLINRLEKRKASKASVVLVTIGLVLDLVLSAGYVATQIQSHNTQIDQCQQANINRREDAAIWNVIIAAALHPDPAEQAQESPRQRAANRKLISDIVAKVTTKDTPRNCTAVYRFPF